MRTTAVLLALSLVFAPGSLPHAQAETLVAQTHRDELGYQLCPLLDSVAHTNALPVGFFARLIWQESRFQPDVIGPLTRSGGHALGIAQFTPGTAAEHGLFAPFDPNQALPKSAALLAELRDQFGNLGLAAAAYNAGPQRVHDFIEAGRALPQETRNYVLTITGKTVEQWAKPPTEHVGEKDQNGAHGSSEVAHCRHVVTMLLKQTPAQRIAMPALKVPGWCRHLNHPNTSVCGPVHEDEEALKTASPTRLRSHLALVDRPAISR